MLLDSAGTLSGPAGYIAIPLEIIPLNESLPYSLYVQIGETPVLLRKAGDTVTAERIQALRERNVTAVQVREDEWAGMLAALERSLSGAASDGGINEETLAVASRNLAMLYWREIERKRDLTTGNLEQLKDVSHRIADAIARNPAVVGSLLRRYNEPNLYFLSHSVNVAVFSIAIGNKQRLSARELRKLAASTLLHNVGNILLPADILYAPRELTADETKTVRAHVTLGADLLASRGASDDMVATALQHHESYDGSGYPLQRKGELIHPFARICRIADTYDALLSARPFSVEPSSPSETIRKLMEMKGQFDPAILSHTSFGK